MKANVLVWMCSDIAHTQEEWKPLLFCCFKKLIIKWTFYRRPYVWVQRRICPEKADVSCVTAAAGVFSYNITFTLFLATNKHSQHSFMFNPLETFGYSHIIFLPSEYSCVVFLYVAADIPLVQSLQLHGGPVSLGVLSP